MKTLAKLKLAGALSLLALLAPGKAHAFGGEDPINGLPWHHQDITEHASYKDTEYEVGFTTEAGQSIAWHADYVDSYLYNPLWWAPGGVPRLKASLSSAPELTKMHFDDLFSADQVRYMWRRYTSGTIAGLLWAKEQGDVNAAQNIVGTGLHAIQDFYSHSNWIDAPARRTKTFFEVPLAERQNLTLFTGSYEQESHLGIKDHGKYAPAASIMLQPGVKELLDLASSGFSPLSNTSLIQTYKKVKDGVPVQPYIPGTDAKVQLPTNILYLAPAGIAVDNTWLAEIAVKERGLTDITGAELFKTAKGLATKQTAQWLKRIETAMNKAGAGDFWKEVKKQGFSKEERQKAYEKFNQFPYTFMSTGEYPPKPTTGQEYYLRVQLKTSGTAFAGTNADIKLRADGKEYLLDYMPGSAPILAHDDFEMGDDEVYTVGPFSQLPTEVTLINKAPGIGDMLKAIANSFKASVEKIRDTALSLIAGHADHIATRKQIWMPEDLAAVTTAPKTFTMELDGKDEGYYRVHGYIKKLSERASDDTSEYEVRLETLECVKESKWDRGSNSDEPFVMMVLSSLPGEVQANCTPVFSDVDKGETRALNGRFVARVPNRYGVLNLPVCVMESDDESKGDRQKLFDAFRGQVTEETADEQKSFLTTLAEAQAADWKLERIRVYAWTRNARIKVGQVCDKTPNQWIDGGKSQSFPLDASGLKDSGIETDSLVAPLSDSPNQNEPEPQPQPMPDPNRPLTDAERAALLNPFIGDWITNIGTTLTIADAMRDPGYPMLVRGSAVKTANKLQAEEFYLGAEPGPTLFGQWSTVKGSSATDSNRFGRVYLTLAPDGNSFDGKVVLMSGNEFVYKGTRVKPNTGGPTPSGDPGTGNGNGNGGTVPPPTGDAGGFQTMKLFSAKLEEFRRGSGETLEAIVTFRNVSPHKIGIAAGVFTATILDDDTLPLRSDGNLYRASGVVGEKPVPLPGTVWLDELGDSAKVRIVFKPQLRITKPAKLTLREYSNNPIVFTLPELK
ncbi:MAG: hypothetical protein QM758_23595 [Armatimonas sp.]